MDRLDAVWLAQGSCGWDDVGPAQVAKAWWTALRPSSSMRIDCTQGASLRPCGAVPSALVSVQPIDAGVSDTLDVRDAFAVARSLHDDAEIQAAEILRAAEAAADVIKAEANRYASKRLNEVELLVGKARRSMTAADDRSKIILDTARAEAQKMLLAAREQARLIIAGRDRPAPSSLAGDGDAVDDEIASTAVVANPGAAAIATELDRLLSEALAKALDLPKDDPYPRRGPGRA
jgi:hypothetical protein